MNEQLGGQQSRKVVIDGLHQCFVGLALQL